MELEDVYAFSIDVDLPGSTRGQQHYHHHYKRYGWLKLPPMQLLKLLKRHISEWANIVEKSREYPRSH